MKNISSIPQTKLVRAYSYVQKRIARCEFMIRRARNRSRASLDLRVHLVCCEPLWRPLDLHNLRRGLAYARRKGVVITLHYTAKTSRASVCWGYRPPISDFATLNVICLCMPDVSFARTGIIL